MRKRTTLAAAALTAALILTTGAPVWAAQNSAPYEDAHCSYTDADGDGICDNGDTHCAYTDADGDGICDSCGNTTRHLRAGLHERDNRHDRMERHGTDRHRSEKHGARHNVKHLGNRVARSTAHHTSQSDTSGQDDFGYRQRESGYGHDKSASGHGHGYGHE